jgi:hypothetical protein
MAALPSRIVCSKNLKFAHKLNGKLALGLSKKTFRGKMDCLDIHYVQMSASRLLYPADAILLMDGKSPSAWKDCCSRLLNRVFADRFLTRRMQFRIRDRGGEGRKGESIKNKSSSLFSSLPTTSC